MMNDTVKHNGMVQPFLISRKLRLLVGVATTSTESYFLLEVCKQLKNNRSSSSLEIGKQASLIMSARGAVYIDYKIGSTTEPWGTPQRRFRMVECSFVTLTN